MLLSIPKELLPNSERWQWAILVQVQIFRHSGQVSAAHVSRMHGKDRPVSRIICASSRRAFAQRHADYVQRVRKVTSYPTAPIRTDRTRMDIPGTLHTATYAYIRSCLKRYIRRSLAHVLQTLPPEATDPQPVARGTSRVLAISADNFFNAVLYPQFSEEIMGLLVSALQPQTQHSHHIF
jgi:hypothetical protein